MGRKLTVLWDEGELGNSVMLFTCTCCRCCPSQRGIPLTLSIENVNKEFWICQGESTRWPWGYIADERRKAITLSVMKKWKTVNLRCLHSRENLISTFSVSYIQKVITFEVLERFQENEVFQTTQTMNNILKLTLLPTSFSAFFNYEGRGSFLARTQENTVRIV